MHIYKKLDSFDIVADHKISMAAYRKNNSFLWKNLHFGVTYKIEIPIQNHIPSIMTNMS